MPSNKYINVQWLVVALIIILCLVVMEEIAPYRQPVPSTDSGIFLYMGDQLLDGHLLYKDAWDHKPPLVFVINAFGLFLRRGSLWGVWFLQLLAVGMASVFGYRLMVKVFGEGPALFGTIIWLLGLRSVLDGGNLTEEYALPFQFLTFTFFWLSTQKRKFSLDLAAGIMAGLAFWLRANIIGIPLAIVLCLLWEFFIAKNGVALKRLVSFGVGFFIVAIIVFSWFAIQNNLPGLLDASFVYNFLYSETTGIERWQSVITGLKITPIAAIFAVSGWCFLVGSFFGRSRFRNKQDFDFTKILLVALPIELILVSLSGRSFPHYFMSLLPIYGLMSAYFLFFIFANTGLVGTGYLPNFQRTVTAGLLISVFIVPFVNILPNTFSTFQTLFNTGKLPENNFTLRNERVLNYLSNNLEPDEGVVFWGKTLSFNWLSARKIPSRYIFQDLFFTEDYANQEMVDEYIRDLEASHVVIIDPTVDNQFIPPIGTPLDELPIVVRSLYEFIDQNYQTTEMVPGTGWPVYRFIEN